MTARQRVLQARPKAKCHKTDRGFRVFDGGGDDCYERPEGQAISDTWPTRAQAWDDAAAEVCE